MTTPRLGAWGTPGQTAVRTTSEREIIWGGQDSHLELLENNGKLTDTSIRDAGNDITTVIRRGLLLAFNSSGYYIAWDGSDFATSGANRLVGVNNVEFGVLDSMTGQASQAQPPVLCKAPLVAAQLLIKGVSLVGHALEYVARRQLSDMHCILDDDAADWLSGKNSRKLHITANKTLVAAEQATEVIVTGGTGVTVTLPAIKAGLKFKIRNNVDQSLTITSPEGTNIVAPNNTGATSLVFNTGANQIGANVLLYVNDEGTSWQVDSLSPNIMGVVA